MKKNRFIEIMRFCIVGGISFLLDFGLLFFCTEYLHIEYLYSAAIAFSVAVIINYWLCIKFVFVEFIKKENRKIILFVSSSMVGLVINQICMYVFVELLIANYLLAKILATIIVTTWNYGMKRRALIKDES